MRTENTAGILLKCKLQKKCVALKTTANGWGTDIMRTNRRECGGIEVMGSYLQWSSCLHHAM